MKKVNIKQLLICILIPVVLGWMVGGLVDQSSYMSLSKPSFAPPSFVFAIVWTILYILMGISSYLILNTWSPDRGKALSTYAFQLMMNIAWSFLFFTFQLELLSFIWILLLIVVVIKMIYQFYQINKTASYLQIPYLLWLIFASYLNISIYLLNR